MKVKHSLIRYIDENKITGLFKFLKLYSKDIFEIVKNRYEDQEYRENVYQDLILDVFEKIDVDCEIEELVESYLNSNNKKYDKKITLNIRNEGNEKEEVIQRRKLNMRNEKVMNRFILSEIVRKFGINNNDIIYKNVLVRLTNANYRDYYGEFKTTNCATQIFMFAFVITNTNIYRMDLTLHYDLADYDRPFSVQSFEDIKSAVKKGKYLKIIFKNQEYLILRDMDYTEYPWFSFSTVDGKVIGALENKLDEMGILKRV